MHTVTPSNPDWLSGVLDGKTTATELLDRPVEEQRREGYFFTLREICQQPSTWRATSTQMQGLAGALRLQLEGIQAVVLTGSGSSEYAGNCVELVLRRQLGIAVQAIGGGELLTHGTAVLPPPRPLLMVSLARSGDSPESVGALSLLLETDPQIRHLVLTCNKNGGLATKFREHPRVRVIALDDRTNDRSLAMTSSFTNMVLAARFLSLLDNPEQYAKICERLSRVVDQLIADHFTTLASVSSRGFQRAVFLGSGSRFGGAREAALKMLELTSGRVTTICETYLGFRHGPMSYVHDDTLVVCFLASDPLVRAYEADLIRELNRKGLGLAKVFVGEDIPGDLVQDGDVVLECEGLAEIRDENAPVVDVVVGQLLAFFRCLGEGLRPDLPSADGVINRVVGNFALHR